MIIVMSNSTNAINTVVIQPFEIGDRVDVSRHHILQDCRTTTGTVVHCTKDKIVDEEQSGMWMVKIKLDNGRVIGVRPSYLDLLK